MKSILNNPYRIAGLLVGSTAREQDRQIKRLKQYILAEQQPDEDYSFPLLGKLPRTIEALENAVSKLNLDSDKISASLFWFYKGNAITDEPAFEALKEGDIETAYQIWDKLITDIKEDGKRSWKPVTTKNYSAFHNYAVLNIIQLNGNLKNAIAGGIYFLDSDLVHDFVSTVADSTYKPSKKDLQLTFLNQLFSDIENSNKIPVINFFEIVSKLQFSAKKDFLKSIVQKPIEQLERLIEDSKTKRKANKANAINYGNSLYKQTIQNIKQLKSILGDSDIKFSSVSDKVAEQLLQCGIDYFKYYRDSNTDPSSATMELFQKAKTIALGSVVRQRIQENTESLQEWINDKPEREKQKEIEDDLLFVTSKLERFQNLSDTVSNAKDLVDSCKPRLISIKNILGSSDDFYLKISGAVATNALGMLISVINEQQNSIDVQLKQFTTLRSTIRIALEVTNNIGSLDMLPEQRSHYNQNHSTLKSIASQLSVSSSSYSSSSSNSGNYRPKTTTSNSSTDNDGCAPWMLWVVGIILLIILIRACD